jgi:DMSO/TMAO reductase YedYZ molybdopterin-dependent catalytic subunit
MKKFLVALMTLATLSTLLTGCFGKSLIGLNKENPVPMGKAYVTSEGIEVTVISLVEGEQAWEILQKANQFNPSPTSDLQYALITIQLKNISSQQNPWEYYFVYWDLFELIGSSNKAFHTYDEVVVLPDEGNIGLAKTTLYHGDEASGILSFYIPQNEKNLVLTWLGQTKADNRFFEVKPVGSPILTPSSTLPGQVEATEFEGKKLTPISQQNNNALSGTRDIDQSTYVLTVDGLVNHPLNLSYTDLQTYPQVSQLTELNCVDGWSFTAKWTGPTLSSIFADAGVQSGAKIAIFYTADDSFAYTSLELSYINDNNIIIALKDNDITLTADRGFPFQVVANGKFGYKWAKWVTRIELSSDTGIRGYWESQGYSNNADINGPAFDTAP